MGRFHHLKWPLVALGLLLLYNLIFKPSFFTIEMTADGYLYGSLIDILNHSSKVVILATGMTLVIATGGVDISVGSVMAIAGAAAASVIVMSREVFVFAGDGADVTAFMLAILLALAVATICGIWNGFLTAGCGIQPMVATLVLMVAGRGIAQLITDGTIITFDDPYLNFIGNGHFLTLPFTTWIAATLFTTLPFTTWIAATLFTTVALLTRKTALGLFVESVGNNEKASRYAGIEARGVKWLVYAVSGFCAGVAGLMVSSNIKCADANHAGLYLELDAILATVIGGTSMAGGRFYLSGSLVGAVLIQTVATMMYANDVNPAIVAVPKAVIVIVVCLLQSETFRSKLSLAFSRKAKGGVA